MTDAPISKAVVRQAAEWLLDLQEKPDDPGLQQKCRNWRAANPEHERAWQRIQGFTRSLQGFSSPLAHATLASRSLPSRRQVMKTLVVLATTGSIAWTYRDSLLWQRWQADLHTGTGERHDMTLADGSLLELDANTSVAIRYDDHQRLLHLIAGQLQLTSAPDPLRRPLRVSTHNGILQALGTRFSVNQFTSAPETEVTVFEGAVSITTAQSASPAGTVAAGSEARFDHQGIRHLGRAGEQAGAWTRGMLVAHDMPLGELLKRLERYRPGHLDCAPQIAHLPVSGTYALLRSDQVLAMLQDTLPVRVQSFSRYWVRLQPK
ncbi:FecR domain-containing protein [Stutzerimonas kirkiae]|uniref:Histidine kinase n=1 Tax=Stutzerimonas kirkiae TaxID=2211392 RepID=A0A4Q9R1Y0_9GAMM|nr:FecR family protein [Stutzerimonas kirkiae]TBU92180.1 histidine kinase [Stutzerimonas kirkiae]TBV01160.1 histidine kinase [Stutzerimonas kirkiae]TBV10463.1 histidine kinase [Stutzerimonas kirkiae]